MIVEQVQKFARRVAFGAIAERLLTIEGRQWRAGPEEADQVDPQLRPQLPMLFEEVHALDVAAGETQARVGLELEVLVERLFVQVRMGGFQTVHHQEHTLEQAVLADAPADPV